MRCQNDVSTLDGKMKRKHTDRQQPKPYVVFVSHATYDKWVAKVMCEKLASADIETFRDDRNIEGGAGIPESIRDAIERCDEVLLLFSPAAIDRQWVTLEIGMAFFARKRIVPILFHAEATQLPGLIDLKRAFDINEFDNYIADVLKRKEAHV